VRTFLSLATAGRGRAAAAPLRAHGGT